MSEHTPGGTFYDKVAQKIGEYRTGGRHHTEYRTGNPEAIFEEKLLGLSGEKIVFDAGSGDGRFTLVAAKHFSQVVGIDVSSGMLEVARKRQVDQGVRNVRFVLQNAAATDFPDGAFDVVYSRRGPTPYREFQRLLKPGGVFLLVHIGDQDALALKQVFGRGQGYDQLGISWLEQSRSFQEEAGVHVLYAEEFLYDEYYPSYADLETFLQGVPIFEDFDPVADQALLQQYVDQASAPKGIQLVRHRFVTVAEKP